MQIFGLAHAATVTAAVQRGFGRHFIFLDSAQREFALRDAVVALLWGYLSPMVGRIAFCVSLLFLTGTDPLVKKMPIWIVISLQLAINITAIIVYDTQCGTHVDLIWTASNHLAEYEADCSNSVIQTYFGYFVGAFNTLTDAFLAALPALLIKHTRLPVKRKIELSFLLCLSVL